MIDPITPADHVEHEDSPFLESVDRAESQLGTETLSVLQRIALVQRALHDSEIAAPASDPPKRT